MSRILKPQFYISLDDKKEIHVSAVSVCKPEIEEPEVNPVSQEEEDEVRKLLSMKEQILRDAESVADEQIRSAMDESAAVRQQAKAEIEDWWQERRHQDDEVIKQAHTEGFEKGQQAGLEQAELQVLEHYESLIEEARMVLEQAHVMKQQILHEAEPFLIELSTAIAGKIIQKELTDNPQWVIDMTRSILNRKREKGSVTLCVSPRQFAYILDARDELIHAMDSQAELQILPDSSVGEYGCVVRTSFGSVDARVDTQLKEIKEALHQLSLEPPAGEEQV